MPSNTFSISAALCLALAIGPASVVAAPQLNGLPLLGGDNTNAAPANGNSEQDAGAGYDVGIPGGPGVHYGAGVHSEHHGPCGPGPSGEKDAGAGFAVGIPGGPGVRFGAGTHDQYEAVPCPEPIAEPTTTTYVQVMIPPTYTTPIVIPTATPAPAYVPPTVVPVQSKPLIPHPAPAPTASAMPSPSPSAKPVFNAGSALAPSSLVAVALPIILGIFY
ncbi:uncharacterized protein N7498_010198 [Penicillium cinerascens]|uniref:Uncharacterized protein n=1 Tax=Penicillium cinerascens TaxID=70096 RepID=A0A9W9M6Z3_9EURO|nr:uncharacterized protein N7498_010198 [Penicillium cinerascens]KAJ5191213.1 hypothetical protein N7498_010198 [Penicillium cinerascens]